MRLRPKAPALLLLLPLLYFCPPAAACNCAELRPCQSYANAGAPEGAKEAGPKGAFYVRDEAGGFAQGGARRCDKVPAGNWSAAFHPYAGHGREASPYQIVSMNLEACNGYLYLWDVSLNVPPDRLFYIVEYTAFVYKAGEADKPLLQQQVYRMGAGDGDLAEDGIWRSTPGKRWGAPFTAGDSPLMRPLLRDGRLEGDFRVEVGLSYISFGKDDVWSLAGRGATADAGKALLEAADNDDVAALRTLLAAGADVNARNAHGETALMHAAGSGHLKSVRLLLKSGADVNAKNADGYTALILAAQYGYVPVARTLLEAGADLAAKNNDGMNALFAAGVQGRGEAWDMLKGLGASVETRAEEFVCLAGLGRTAEVEKMLADGVGVNAKGPRDYTAVLLASLNGHAEAVRLLIARGADVNAADKYAWSPLSWALFAHKPEVMRMLIKAGADLNFRDMQGATPLIAAVQFKYEEGARMLVEAGADTAAQDNAGKTALDYAVEQANTGPVQTQDPLVKLLRAAAAKR